ncbi:MAG: lysylphosphatidylglycerol synthase domain-containing protein [Thermomicrobiales bacterium]
MGECLAFYLVLTGLGMESGWHVLLTATFVLAVSTLAGGASMLPGGIGVADASVAGMLLLLVDDEAMSRTVAVAATLIIRFATLWFAVLIGMIAVVVLERRTIPRLNAVRSPSAEGLPK